MSSWYWPNGAKSIPYVTSEWNPRRRHPVLGVITPHNGIDTIGYDYNRAIGPGVVTAARYEGGAGWTVRILHDDGSEAAQKHHEPGLLVRVGQRVKPRQIIGLQGSSGLVTGKHNHLETRYYPGGPSIDPRVFMSSRLMSLSDVESTRIPQEEHTMLWLKSSRTGHWYLIEEFNHRPIREHAEAKLVSEAIGRNSLEVSPASIQAAVQRVEENRSRFAGGTTTEGVAAAVKAALEDDFDEVVAEVNRPRTLS